MSTSKLSIITACEIAEQNAIKVAYETTIYDSNYFADPATSFTSIS
jgi:hypothetical protein